MGTGAIVPAKIVIVIVRWDASMSVSVICANIAAAGCLKFNMAVGEAALEVSKP